ncbi:MAG: DNA polymerase IV [Bacillota bacterium]|nr:DNA polymerase IV [Bacillota bacterium]
MKIIKDILLCDLDAFFASVEQRDRPELQGKPVIVGGSPDGRGVVSTCSYEARKFGVHSAMPMKKALSLCPGAVIIRGRMSRYKEVAGQVRHIFSQYTPDIEIVSIDEAYLAFPAGKGLKAGLMIHDHIKEELKLSISVGVSTNKLLAKIACELAKPDRVKALWAENVDSELWPLSIRVLPGIGPVTGEKLNRLGIRTVKDLAAYPLESLNRTLGSNANLIHGYAHGIDDRNIEPEHVVKSISEETTFSDDLYDPDTIHAILLELSAGVGYRLRSANLTGRTVTLKLRFSDFSTITRGKTLTNPADSDSDIYKTAQELFSRHKGKPPWRLIGIQVSGLEQGGQLSLLSPTESEEKEKKLTEIRDRLHQKYGNEVIFQARRLKKED